MESIEILKFSLSVCNDCRDELLRLIHSLYHLGLNGKMWVFKRPQLWQEYYKFAEDLSKIIQLTFHKNQQDMQKIELSASIFQSKKMRDLLEELNLLDRELEDSLKELLLERVIAPNEAFLYATVIADMLLAERRRYTIQFWTTLLIGILSAVGTIVAAYIGFVK